jgi:hypothetical protein
MDTDYNTTLLNARAQGFPRMGLVKQDKTVDVVLSKLVTANHATGAKVGARDNQGRPIVVGPDMGLMERISDQTASNIVDAESLFQLLPDTELAMQILVSSILSPKDMVETKITYAVEKGSFPPELAAPCLKIIEDHFNNVYKISEKAPDQLRDALFRTGSHALLVLPESSIDHAINSNSRLSAESLSTIMDPRTKLPRHIGLLGNPGKDDGEALSLESMLGGIVDGAAPSEYQPAVAKLEFELPFQVPNENREGIGDARHVTEKVKLSIDPLLSIVDNPQILRVPDLLSKARRDRLNDLIRPNGLATEAFVGSDRLAARLRGKVQGADKSSGKDEREEAKVRGSTYRHRNFRLQQILSIQKPSQLARESVGHPLEMNVPSECIIPVHVPSQPEQHLGYFMLTDRQGNPLVKTQESDYFTEMSNNLKTNRELVSQLTANVKRATLGADWYSRQMDIDEMTRVYSDMVEVQLQQRLQAGLYRDGAQVAKPQEIYRIMFARALAGMHTQLLYVPAELMTYIAFDYNQYGVGVSLMQKSKIIGGLRAMLLFADTMAAIKNSVGRTIVSINLDENDPDPASSVEGLMHEFAYARSNGLMPLGATAPRDIINYMQQASVEYVISGNPRYPTTSVNVEDRQNNRVRPDDKLQEDLKKRQMLSFGLAPEMIDAAQGPEFATSVVANNLLLAKRVLLWQKIYTSHLQDHVARYTLNSGILMDRLREAIEHAQKTLAAKEAQNPKPDEEVAGKSEANQNLRDDTIDSYAQRPDNTSEVDGIILDFIHALRVQLPKPEQASMAVQMEAFEKYQQALDTALKAYITTDFLRELEMGDGETDVQTVIEATKAYFMRDYMRTNRLFTELEILTQTDEDGPALDLQEANGAHVESMRASVAKYLEEVLMRRKAWDKRIANLKGAGGVQDLTDTSSPSSAPSSSGDMGGGSDAGMGGLDGLDGMDTEISMDTGEDTGEEASEGDEGAATPGADAPAEPTA